MKKAIFITLLAMGMTTVLTSCGGKKTTENTSPADSTSGASTTPEAPAAKTKVDEIFGGNLFWGASYKMSLDDAKKLSIPNSETDHDVIEKSYAWSHTYDDGSSWDFSLKFTGKGKLESLDFAYEPLTNAEARAFSDDFLKAIEAKQGKHTNDDTSGNTDFDWENENYLVYMFAPEKGAKDDVRVGYTETLLED
jgi:hypothetical protein